jgi:hypothetical protein
MKNLCFVLPFGIFITTDEKSFVLSSACIKLINLAVDNIKQTAPSIELMPHLNQLFFLTWKDFIPGIKNIIKLSYVKSI